MYDRLNRIDDAVNNMSGDTTRLVVVNYEDLASSKDMSAHLDRAFGGRVGGGGECIDTSSSSSPPSPSSPLGIIAVRNVPGFVDAKAKFLPMAHALAHLDPNYLEGELSDPRSLYNAGW